MGMVSLYILCLTTWASFYTVSCDLQLMLRILETDGELCGYFGGHCGIGYCQREMRHNWDIALCHGNRICCTVVPIPITTAVTPNTASTTISNHVPKRAEELNECTNQNGVCSAWYNNCTGTVVQLRCDNLWQSCCMHTQEQLSGRHGNTPSLSAPPSPAQESRATESNPDQRITPGRCGQQIRAPRQKRIVGGSLSPSGTWPWHVGISSALGYMHCAGTIIHNKWILTAAHCFKKIQDYSLYRVVSGTHSQQSLAAYSIKRVVKHSLYEEHHHVNMVGHSHKYDIALVELNEAIAYTDLVQPACLPSSTDSYEGKTCWLAGWGSTRYNGTDDEFRLRHVRGSVLSRSACRTHWGNLVDGKMLCFGNERRGGCTGDSGGGMFCQNADGFYTIAGVISWGSAQCNVGATVLTDIAQYISWIHSTLNS